MSASRCIICGVAGTTTAKCCYSKPSYRISEIKGQIEEIQDEIRGLRDAILDLRNELAELEEK